MRSYILIVISLSNSIHLEQQYIVICFPSVLYYDCHVHLTLKENENFIRLLHQQLHHISLSHKSFRNAYNRSLSSLDFSIYLEFSKDVGLLFRTLFVECLYFSISISWRILPRECHTLTLISWLDRRWAPSKRGYHNLALILSINSIGFPLVVERYILWNCTHVTYHHLYLCLIVLYYIKILIYLFSDSIRF